MWAFLIAALVAAVGWYGFLRSQGPARVAIRLADAPGMYVYEVGDVRDVLVISSDGSFLRTLRVDGQHVSQTGRWDLHAPSEWSRYSFIVFSEYSPECGRVGEVKPTDPEDRPQRPFCRRTYTASHEGGAFCSIGGGIGICIAEYEFKKE